jgi:phosphotransferase system enzyme I (PtsP)
VLDAAGDRPVTIRTLDIGADKSLPYLRQPKEDNPAMGWRATRLAIERPALLKLQLRALLMAAAGRDLRVMFPMIADVAEFRAAKALVEEERHYLKQRGHALPRSLQLGAMVEVPALIWQLDGLLTEVDFASIGSNDLLQFLFASDRGNSRLASRYDPLSPPLLAAIRHIIVRADAHGVPLNLCGEMAGRPLEAMALIGIGLRSISMAPAAVGPVKGMILELDRTALWAMLEPLLASAEHSLRPRLETFAKDHAIPVAA